MHGDRLDQQESGVKEDPPAWPAREGLREREALQGELDLAGSVENLDLRVSNIDDPKGSPRVQNHDDKLFLFPVHTKKIISCF